MPSIAVIHANPVLVRNLSTEQCLTVQEDIPYNQHHDVAVVVLPDIACDAYRQYVSRCYRWFNRQGITKQVFYIPPAKANLRVKEFIRPYVSFDTCRFKVPYKVRHRFYTDDPGVQSVLCNDNCRFCKSKFHNANRWWMQDNPHIELLRQHARQQGQPPTILTTILRALLRVRTLCQVKQTR